jgi:hypothetical protein
MKKIILGVVVLVLLVMAGFARANVWTTIDFDGVEPYTSYNSYSEDGFILKSNNGSQVVINNALPLYSNAAAPSLGFGNGNDYKLILTQSDGLLFDVKCFDLLEATWNPKQFGITATGVKADLSTVSQTFILDGQFGGQTFFFGPEFNNLTSLDIGKNFSDIYFLEIVKVDNIVVWAVPEPATVLLLGLRGMVLRKRIA